MNRKEALKALRVSVVSTAVFLTLAALGCKSEKATVEVGSVVRVKGHFGRMAVEKIDGTKVHCVWEVEENSGLGYAKGYRRGEFELAVIEAVP